MSDLIERLRYFDGEYLRSLDFMAEQDYHRLVRYRLNRVLHLTGIAAGLFLEEDQDSVPGFELFHITQGLAIDVQGREILLAQPYSLSPDLVLKKKGLKTGLNNVWLVYSETTTTPPSVGYAACNQQSQNTRWLESFTVDFTPYSPGKPQVHTGGAVLLGIAQIDPGISGLKISSVQNVGRSYVGIDAQRAVHPILADPTLDPTKLNGTGASLVIPALSPPDQVIQDVPDGSPAPEGWFDVQAGIFGRRDLYAAGNTVLGQDFDPGAKKPSLSGTRGNVKIFGDVMLKGQLYSAQGANWETLDTLMANKVAGLLPDVQVLFQTGIPPDKSGANFLTTGTFHVTVTSKLPTATKADILASVARVQFASKADVNTWLGALPGNLDVSVIGSAAPIGGTPNQFDVTLTWTVNPPVAPSATPTPVVAVDIAYLFVARP